MQKITKDMIIADVLKVDVELAPFFFAFCIHCLGCPSAAGETIEEACMVHNTDCDALIEKMNNFLEIKANSQNA